MDPQPAGQLQPAEQLNDPPPPQPMPEATLLPALPAALLPPAQPMPFHMPYSAPQAVAQAAGGFAPIPVSVVQHLGVDPTQLVVQMYIPGAWQLGVQPEAAAQQWLIPQQLPGFGMQVGLILGYC